MKRCQRSRKKKRCQKNLALKNIVEFGGSLHNRTLRKATKSKTREMQAGGLRLSGHRRSVSFSNNDAAGQNGNHNLTLNSQECFSEGRGKCYYENNSQKSLINRCNRRQWRHLDKEIGPKMWKAMESLGVVHKGEEADIFERLDKLENQSLLRKVGMKETKICSL